MNNAICTVIVVVLLALCASKSEAQYKKNINEYYDYYNASLGAKHEGKIDSAIYYARMAMRADTNNSNPCSYLANLLIQKGDFKAAVRLLERSILMGNSAPEKLEYLFDNYDSIKARPEIIQFGKKIPMLVRTYYATRFNHRFASFINKMEGRDQSVRAVDYDMYKDDSVKRGQAGLIQTYLDSAVNLPELVKYLKTNGFPAYWEMDDDAKGSLRIIIHHLAAFYSGPVADELHRLVQAAIYEGRYPPNAYMLALDWGSINRTGKQIYGTYIGPGEDGETTFYPPIGDIGSVDQRRAKWKQGPLKDVPLSDWRKPKMPAGYNPIQ